MRDTEMMERLASYCRSRFGEPSLAITALEPIPEGHSGFTYFVDFDSQPSSQPPRRMVMRLPPLGARTEGPADVCRQGRIMSALRAQGLPVPEVPVICDDPEVLDGRPFILMEAVDGVRAEVAAATWDHHELARSVIAVMKQVHAADIDAAGLPGEPVSALGDELRRWERLIVRAPRELTGPAPRASKMLLSSMPKGSQPSLVHGDFTYGNLLYRDGRAVVLLDWEIAQLGEPLLDLGSLCMIAKRHEFPNDPNPSGAIQVPVPWLLAEYGAQKQPAEWFVALSYFKYAAILGYNTMLHRRGKRPDPIYDVLPDTVVGLLDGVIELLT